MSFVEKRETTDEIAIKERGAYGRSEISGRLRELAARHEHLRRHLAAFKKRTGLYPELMEKPKAHKIVGLERANVIYPIGKLLFSHVYNRPKRTGLYYAIEPSLSEREGEFYRRIRRELVARATDLPPIESEEDYEPRLEELFDRIVTTGDGGRSMFDALKGKKSERFSLPGRVHDKILYRLKRDIAGLGPLEPLLKDRTNEDVHVLGPNKVYVFNKLFRLLRTNINFGSEEEYRELLKILAKRAGSQPSDSNPVVDSVLPDGSRLNIIYPDDVSVEGPTLSIRQYEKIPPSVFRIVKWGTLSPELAAYLWLCLESDVSVAVCGETAAGKTTTLNSITAFIEGNSKIYTAEDTPELKVPHKAWQRLISRETAGRGGVPLFELVKASLRSRPDYIIIGEVRGAEAFNVFQAMQTGHPTLFTFHAGNIVALIHRFTGEPLNVPETFFGNLNVSFFQNFIEKDGGELRRVTSVQEIEGYSEQEGGIISRQVFTRDSARDRLTFTGENNSYILESKVATTLGFEDPRDIYGELERRARVVEEAITENILGYWEVVDMIRAYQKEGLDGLPFDI